MGEDRRIRGRRRLLLHHRRSGETRLVCNQGALPCYNVDLVWQHAPLAHVRLFGQPQEVLNICFVVELAVERSRVTPDEETRLDGAAALKRRVLTITFARLNIQLRFTCASVTRVQRSVPIIFSRQLMRLPLRQTSRPKNYEQIPHPSHCVFCVEDPCRHS